MSFSVGVEGGGVDGTAREGIIIRVHQLEAFGWRTLSGTPIQRSNYEYFLRDLAVCKKEVP